MSALKDIVRVPCPQCGGDVPIYNRFTHQAVCEYCHSVVVYGEDAVKVRGKMSVLPASALKIPLYGQGSIQGKNFMVLGRIRYKWERGIWDEYFLGFDDGSLMWLTEDDAEIYLENVGKFPKNTIDWEAISPGKSVELVGKNWIITEKNTAVCVGGEGQLPFELVEGEALKFFECENDDGEVGTYEIDEDGEKFFYGKRINYNELNLPEPDIPGEVISAKPAKEGEFLTQISGTVRALSCKSCGGAMVVETKDGVPDAVKCPYCGFVEKLGEKTIICNYCQTEISLKSGQEAGSVTCPSCNSLINPDTSEIIATLNELNNALSRVPKSQYVLANVVPLGTKITLEGVKYEVIGRIVYNYYDSIQEEGGYYTEFMLFNAQKGYLWLECSDGHWSYGRKIPLSSHLQKQIGNYRLNYPGINKPFKKYNGNIRSKIIYVEGELPWVAKIGDMSKVIEYASPPYSVSIEESTGEIELYLMTYLPVKELKQNLEVPEEQKKKLPRPSSWPAPNKPYPEWKKALQRMSFLVGILSLVLLLYGEFSKTLLYKETVPLSNLISVSQDEPPPSFVLNNKKSIDLQGAKILDIDLSYRRGGETNFWLYFDIEIIDPETQEAVGWIGAELSHYSGYDNEGYWEENNLSSNTSIRIENLQAVFATLTLSQFDQDFFKQIHPEERSVFVKIYKKPYNSWAYLYLVIIGLIIGIIMFINKSSFDARRLGTYQTDD